jgi:uncharacterized protein YciI
MGTDPKLFWIDFIPCRGDFFTTLTEAETAIMVGHLKWLEVHQEAGRVHFAGRTSDASHAVAILEAASEEEVRRELEENPACEAGLLTPNVKPYKLPSTT